MLNIQEMAEKYGKENLIIKFKMLPLHSAMGLFNYTTSTDKPQEVHCQIVEDRYEVAEGYKIGIRACSAGFGGETFYQSDFSDLVRDGRIKVFAYVKGVLVDVSEEMKFQDQEA